MVVSALTLVLSTSAFAATVIVTPASLAPGGHWYTADTRAAVTGTGTFEVGPATPPYGIGSFELRTTANADKVQFFTDLYNGVKLSTIDGIGYQTYRDPLSTGGPATVASLNMRVDLDGNGSADAYMVYEPYQDQGNAAVLTGVWQSWDAYAGGIAKWWINTGAGGCGQGTPCAWATIIATFPDATVREGTACGNATYPKSPCPGSLGVNQGSFNPGIISNVDGLYVSVAGFETTYDFEPYIVATNKDQCKNGGWQTAKRANGTGFKNQGDCVSYTNNGK